MILDIMAMSETGLCRQNNQDSVLALNTEHAGLFAVADGMGGHYKGELASQSAVSLLRKWWEEIQECILSIPFLEIVAALEKKIRDINKDVYRMYYEMNQLGGTTLCLLLIQKNTYAVINVGDSRLYVIGGEMRQITVDHSLVEEMVRMGGINREEARNHPDKNIITRAVGAKDDVEVDFFNLELQTGDRVLLCSDGLTNMVDDETICRISKNGSSLRDRVEELVETANLNGGRDNISVIVIEPLADEVEHD